MVVQPGVVLGRYKVESLIGRGGMGEVYRARDTTLGRDVAIKALPESLAANPERLSRFEREAHLLASLNHPHIAVVYGFERVDGVPFLAMELVPGENLAERLSRGAIALEEALPLFHQIAEALEAAHEKGIVHRDLKPANVKVTPEGKVKVLDFGLAKALDDESREGELSESPTNTYGATRAGAILGTASYMSPEQARGKKVDARTDIWALGAVMFEVLTGKQAFPGETTSDVIAAILKNEPDWEALPAATRTLLRRCLQKDPARRIHHAADVRIEIEEARTAPDATVSKRGVVPWAAFVAMSVIAGLSLWAPWREAPSRPVVSARLDFPDVGPVPAKPMNALAISPDGDRVVYAGSRAGQKQLFQRELHKFEASPIAGTEGGYGPFFSPDGKWLAFFAAGKLKKVPIDGGPIQVIADAPNPRGGTWGQGDVIAFVASPYTGLVRVSAAGGAGEVLTRPEPGENHQSPRFLPGGRVVLMVAQHRSLEGEIDAVNLETGVRKTLVKNADSPAYLASGHLVYNLAGTLFAAPFDPVGLEPTGPAVAITGGVFVQSGTQAQYDVSIDGALVYVPRTSLDRGQLVSVDRQGSERPLTSEPRAYGNLKLSPDGKRVALTIFEGVRSSSVWVFEMSRDSLTRLPFDGVTNSPVWSPDGLSIAFSVVVPQFQLVLAPADASRPAEPLTEPGGYLVYANSWTPDGRGLVYVTFKASTGADLWTLSLDDGVRKASPWLASSFNDRGAEISPDGRFLAYLSDESGQYEVYVQPFPGQGAKWKISTNGGTEPCWARSGQELFYREDDKMMAVRIDTRPEFSASKPSVLFTGYRTSVTAGFRYYDVFPDGEHFLMIRSEEPPGSTELALVQNWGREVERLAPKR